MHQYCAALPSTAGIYAQQNELQSGEDKPNIFHQSRENMQLHHDTTPHAHL